MTLLCTSGKFSVVRIGNFVIFLGASKLASELFRVFISLTYLKECTNHEDTTEFPVMKICFRHSEANTKTLYCEHWIIFY